MPIRPPDALAGEGDDILPGLAEWMSQQRWYAAKGRTPRLVRTGGWSTRVNGAIIRTHYLLDHQPTGDTLYQVPLSHRMTPLDGVDPIPVDDFGEPPSLVYDAPHDPDYARAILGLIAIEGAVEGSVEGGVEGVHGHRQPGSALGADPIEVSASTVLRGEQSNTSIICATEGGPNLIIKVFRALHSGDNPDVVLQSAIAATGSKLVPAPVGALSAEWPRRARQPGAVSDGVTRSAEMVRGHVAFAQEFLEGAEDGWRMAVRAAASGTNFATEARALGVATAGVHEALGSILSTRESTADDVERGVAMMRARADVALTEVPTLETVRPQIEAALVAAHARGWPKLQRIHGDYHLAQALSVPSRGWVIVDFEGEPLRAMADRSDLDSPLRDVAGMLRSFDYVAGAVVRGEDASRAAAASLADWARASRAAFLAGYAEASDVDLDGLRPVLDAFELDKALYEVVYEARNRPDWLAIPCGAILRLAAQGES